MSHVIFCWEGVGNIIRNYIFLEVSRLKSVEILKWKFWHWNDWREQNLHRPKIPKNPDEQSAGFMHRPKIPKNPDEQSAGFVRRPKIPKNPGIFWNFVSVLPDSSKKILGFFKILGLCVPKNLGILGTLGPVHELGNLGPVQVLWRPYVELCLFSKNAFCLCLVMVNLRIPAEGLHFLVEFLKMENRILVLHSWVLFKTDDCIRN